MRKILFTYIFLNILICDCKTATALDSWHLKASVGGSARSGAFGFSIGTKGYIGSGFGTSYSRDFWEYNSLTNTWAQKADYGGIGRAHAVAFSIASKGYVGTGINGYERGDFWMYDTLTNAWSSISTFGTITRNEAVGFSVGGKGYIALGFGIVPPGHIIYLNDLWEYDPALDSWSQKTDFPGPDLRGAVSFVIGNKAYVGTGTNSTARSAFLEYDPSANSWIQKADFAGTVRYNAVGFSIGDKGYIGTGSYDEKSFWEYDTLSDSWTRKTDFGGKGRENAVGFSIGNKGYIGTGDSSGNRFSDFWEYTPGSAVSVNEINNSIHTSVFPNPFTEKITLKNFQAGSKFELYDITGRLISESNIETAYDELELTDLKVGVYFLVIIQKDKTICEKLIKGLHEKISH